MSKQMEAQLRQAKQARAEAQAEVARLNRALLDAQDENDYLNEQLKRRPGPSIPAGWRIRKTEKGVLVLWPNQRGGARIDAGDPRNEICQNVLHDLAIALLDGGGHASVPAGLKLVPVELIERAAISLERFANDTLAGRNSAHELRELLAAAPAVQGEPVSLRQRLFNGWEGCSNHGCVVVDPKPGMMRTNGSCQCVVNASRSQLYMLQGRIQSVLSAAPQPAEQQPAPDVAGLVEALESLLRHAKKMGRTSVVYDKSRAALAASPEPPFSDDKQEAPCAP